MKRQLLEDEFPSQRHCNYNTDGTSNYGYEEGEYISGIAHQVNSYDGIFDLADKHENKHYGDSVHRRQNSIHSTVLMERESMFSCLDSF